MQRIEGNPFSPANPATSENFVGRTTELLEFEQRLALARVGSPNGIAISGDWGIGKTSLLSKFENVALKEGALVIRVDSIVPDVDISKQFAYLLINQTQLKLKRLAGINKLEGHLELFTENLAKQIKQNEHELSFRPSSSLSYQFLLKDFLERFWQEAGKYFSSVVFLIDEMDRLQTPSLLEAVMFLRNSFQQLAEIKAKYLVVVSGRKILVEKTEGEFAPLFRFFHKIDLGPFSLEETYDFVRKRLSTTQITIADDVIQSLFEETEGHPSVLAISLMILFRELPEEEMAIEEKHYLAFKEFIANYIATEFFVNTYKATTQGAKRVLRKIAELPYGPIRFSDIVKYMQEPAENVSPYLAELVRKGCLYRISRGEYKFFHKLFHRYVLSQDPSKIKPKTVIRVRKPDLSQTHIDKSDKSVEKEKEPRQRTLFEM